MACKLCGGSLTKRTSMGHHYCYCRYMVSIRAVTGKCVFKNIIIKAGLLSILHFLVGADRLRVWHVWPIFLQFVPVKPSNHLRDIKFICLCSCGWKT